VSSRRDPEIAATEPSRTPKVVEKFQSMFSTQQ
jgi:hypothetical protein